MIEHSRVKDSSPYWGTQNGEAESTCARGTVSTTISNGNVSRAIGRTVDDWARVMEYDREFKKNNLAFERVKDELFQNYIGKWVAFENGNMIVANSAEELKLSKDVKHRIIIKVTDKLLKQPKEIYLGGTSLRIE
ncbi:MAG: hypothetical protein ACUVXA_15715 [Candidatus Jordarchaeum sp.]|uniref:hypothetical protein n=1 Tax=Candidatus Jordarchaeum sp. TaxID=2823881 RepID=UPI00404AD5BD